MQRTCTDFGKVGCDILTFVYPDDDQTKVRSEDQLCCLWVTGQNIGPFNYANNGRRLICHEACAALQLSIDI